MGWKKVKDHYRIGHFVTEEDGVICIGSGYIHRIMAISADGRLFKRDTGLSNPDLRRYEQEMDADPQKLAELVADIDEFSQDLEVFTFDGSRVVRKLCEERGWPNVTHDGMMMYENTFFASEADAAKNGLGNLSYKIKYMGEKLHELQKSMDELKQDIALTEQNKEALLASYPHLQAEDSGNDDSN